MNRSIKLVGVSILGVLLGVVGCAADHRDPEATDVAPAAEEDGVEQQAAMTYGGFTMNALTPTFTLAMSWPATFWNVTASMQVTGGAGAQRMGVCLLTLARNSSWSPVTCSTVADCGSVAVPTGGFKYCTNINNVGQKYCFVRQGAQTSYCAGSPANGGLPIGNGTYTTGPIFQAPNSWISYACVNGCATTDPSVSSYAGATSGL
jgi:hypothetical protein